MKSGMSMSSCISPVTRWEKQEIQRKVRESNSGGLITPAAFKAVSSSMPVTFQAETPPESPIRAGGGYLLETHRSDSNRCKPGCSRPRSLSATMRSAIDRTPPVTPGNEWIIANHRSASTVLMGCTLSRHLCPSIRLPDRASLPGVATGPGSSLSHTFALTRISPSFVRPNHSVPMGTLGARIAAPLILSLSRPGANRIVAGRLGLEPRIPG